MPKNYKQDKRYAHLTFQELQQFYETEKELRDEILKSKPEERVEKTMWAYDELFRKIPWHPALTEKSGEEVPELSRLRAEKFARLIGKPCKVLEIGCGMGNLMIGLSNMGYDCTGLDVSEIRIAKLKHLESESLKFVHAEGTVLPFEDGSYDVVISMQLFEHLHADDAAPHLREVRRILSDKGKYFLETPNKLIGPSDVSRFFTDGEPEGFHLKEYSIQSLSKEFYKNGYSKVNVILWYSRNLPAFKANLLETIWSFFPKNIRRKKTFGMHNPLYEATK